MKDIQIFAPIQCSWCGRNDDNIKVIGATSLAEARTAALAFLGEVPGIVLDRGQLETWLYDEAQPADWQDYYIFCTEDEFPVDLREWWEN